MLYCFSTPFQFAPVLNYALSFLVLCPLVGYLYLFKPFFLMGISFLIYTQFFRNAAGT